MNFVFEAGAHGWGDAHQAAMQVINHPTARSDFHVGTFTAAEKAERTQLQAADMLAWHWLKHCRRKRQGIKPLQKDFKALIEVPVDAHYYDHSAVDFLIVLRGLSPAELSALEARSAH